MHVQHLVYEPRRGGVSQHVISVVRSLPEVRHSVLLAAGLPGVSAELIAAGADVTTVPIRSRVLPRAAWRALPQQIATARADLVHLHNFHTGLFGSLAAGLGGARRVVFTPQTLSMRKRVLRPAFLALLRQAARRHDAWVAVNRAQQREFQAVHPDPARVHWCPNAAPPTPPLPDRETSRRRLGLPRDGLVVAYVGRLSAEKDPLAFARAARELTQATFVLAGDGPLRAEVEHEVAASPHVRLLGFVDPVTTVYAAADVLCLPSRWEGLPYALLEGLSHGLPAVASQIDGTRDLIDDGQVGGVTFPPGDVAALTAALARLLSDAELRASLGASGRARIDAEFSEAAAGARLRRIYASLLDG